MPGDEHDVVDTTKEALGRVVLDVTRVDHLGPEGVAILGDWLAFLKDARQDGLAPSTLRFDETVKWQRVAAQGFQRIDGALRMEMAG